MSIVITIILFKYEIIFIVKEEQEREGGVWVNQKFYDHSCFVHFVTDCHADECGYLHVTLCILRQLAIRPKSNYNEKLFLYSAFHRLKRCFNEQT